MARDRAGVISLLPCSSLGDYDSMEPRWRSPCGRAEIYCADCREVDIPATGIVITDPPYNIGTPQRAVDQSRGRNRLMGKDFGEAFDMEAIEPSQWVPLMSDTVVTFCGAKQFLPLLRAFKKANYELVQDFHWCKSNAPPPLRRVGFAWATESGFIFRKQGKRHLVNTRMRMSPNWFLCPSVVASDRHPTQKPVKLMSWLVSTFSVRDSLVVDPFLGYGSTGVAAVSKGRRFMGVELREDYCQRAIIEVSRALKRWQHCKLG